ncbi:nicotinate-nucleotide adenylyltransferase [Synechococcus sp. HK01-R]|uniref:nicotinate-nucleotide adenylyltransferase n=1 Tax=Synechococcus sp. HK01-R TaxID=2751171 RepID=UPI00162966DD|nr:nicotinate-nucleotide adenylyltransferase [Synechococcus sp. HK01-R]QNG28186.1 nicotinate-nucleotide adenylyltransferase [Synechococcus sp. HK01-R]
MSDSPTDKIALLGTSADPPTRGHQALLEGLCKQFPRVATWASDNPSKQHVIELNQRLELLDALVQSINNPRLELVQELSSPFAITTVTRAEQRWPGLDLCFVVGSDLISQIPRWKDASTLLGHCRLAIVPRQGWPLQDAELKRLRSLGGRLEILPLGIPGTASSEIRSRAAASQIPDALEPLLLKHNFYGFTRGND